MEEKTPTTDRRNFLRNGGRTLGFLAVGGVTGRLLTGASGEKWVWQIDPAKCIQCGSCATACVITPSASRCTHDYSMCGYCRICSCFFPPDAPQLNEGAENQLCPTGAIKRTFVEEPYYEYSVDQNLCIGCARCVKGCTAFGNGSMYMQVRRDLCVDCNECAISVVCEGKAFRLIPESEQYLPKGAPYS